MALTADTTDGVDARCTLAGFHRVLTKPADMDTVRAALEAMALFHVESEVRSGALTSPETRTALTTLPHSAQGAIVTHTGGQHNPMPPALAAALTASTN